MQNKKKQYAKQKKTICKTKKNNMQNKKRIWKTKKKKCKTKKIYVFLKTIIFKICLLINHSFEKFFNI
jgi:hypothetical protein